MLIWTILCVVEWFQMQSDEQTWKRPVCGQWESEGHEEWKGFWVEKQKKQGFVIP